MGANHGLVTNLVGGIVGAFIGGFLARSLGIHFFGFAGQLVVATGGALLLLYLLKIFRQRA